MPQPEGLGRTIAPDTSAVEILDAFLGIPYADDGAIDESGDYVFFARPWVRQEKPGLNCSGFVLGACRFLLHRNISLEQAGRDRLADSGPESPHGQDWDFGWDVIMNISEGFSRAILLPGNKVLEPEQADGFSPRGYDLHAPATWLELPARLQPDKLYLLSFSKETRTKGYSLLHYHVGLIFPDQGRLWMYQTTTGAGTVYRRDLANSEERAAFLQAFANTGGIRKHLLVLEVDPQSGR